MRRSLLLICALTLWPALASAAPSVKEIIDRSVNALENTCYEARMVFLSQFDNGEEQVVRIFHCAPHLYRVEPLDKKNKETIGVVYVEDADRLVRLVGDRFAEELPDRRFNINDQLTVKFLSDLAKHPGTIVLDGMVDSYPVYILRQDKIREKPYTVTVGIDKENYFPLLLLVNDSAGERRVYFEMEAIEYRKPGEMPKGLFAAELEGMQQRAAPNTPMKVSAEVQDQGGKPQVVIQRPGSPEHVSCALPLLPEWLPGGYNVKSIGVLDYFPGVDEPTKSNSSASVSAKGPALPSKVVFRIEARGESLYHMISVIQTQADQQPYDFGGAKSISGQGFYMTQADGWLVAVIGGPELTVKEMKRIVDSLEASDKRVAELIRQTRLIDHIMHLAGDNGDG